jgi:dUTP pyrophosphatase
MLKVKLLHDTIKTPLIKNTTSSAGYDIKAYVNSGSVVILPGTRYLIKTGIMIEPPAGCYIRIAPRSGLSLKGIDIGGGVIDADYRGEVGIIVINNSSAPFIIDNGDRIAQLICELYISPDIEITDVLSETERSNKGFGSSGV